MRLDGLNWYELKLWIAHAPLESHISMVAASPEEWTRAHWSLEVELLSAIEFRLHQLVWAKTEDGAKGLNPPERIQPPAVLEPEMKVLDNEEEGKQVNLIGGQGVEFDVMRRMLGWDERPESE